MRARMSFIGLVVAAILAAAGCAPSTQAPIGIQSVHATSEFRVPTNPREVALFVETGSVSQHCLATLHESQLEAPVQELYCAPRTATFDGGATKVDGLWVHVFFAGDPGEAMGLWVNVYQEGASSFGEPRYCSTEQGC